MNRCVFGILVGSVLATTTLDLGTSQSHRSNTCCCPQKCPGWLLFEDSNYGVPDFWWEESVAVREIIVCEHGIHFLFPAEQDGRPHYVALVIVKPTRELFEARWIPEIGDRPMDVQLARNRTEYKELLTLIDSWWGERFTESGRLDFADACKKPVIVPWRKLVMIWGDKEIKLRGYLDVYMTLPV